MKLRTMAHYLVLLAMGTDALASCCVTCPGIDIPSKVTLALNFEDKTEVINFSGNGIEETLACGPEPLYIRLESIDEKHRAAFFKIYSKPATSENDPKWQPPLAIQAQVREISELRCVSGALVKIQIKRLIPATTTVSYSICGAKVSSSCGSCMG